MAKSKEQKRKEAQERAQSFLHVHHKYYQDKLRDYDSLVKLFGREEADRQKSQATKALDDACHRAGVDRDGNPVSGVGK